MGWGRSIIRHIFPTALGTLITLALLASAAPVWAADISAEPIKPGEDRQFIALVGDIKQADVETFRRIALAHDNAVVWLSSNGGEMYPAIEIGRMIRLKGYDTYVSNSDPCNSACALIFVAGSHRYLSRSGQVGFHATYLDQNGRKEESGVGNAVIGSYFAQLNLGESAVVFATTAPPDRINALTVTNSETAGISVSLVDDIKEDKETSSWKIQPSYGQVGDWAIGVDNTVGGGCFIVGTWSGVTFRLGLDNRAGHIGHYLIFLGENWKSIQEHNDYELAIRFDQNDPWNMSGSGIDMGGTKGILVHFEDQTFLGELHDAAAMQVIYKGQIIEQLSTPDAGAALDVMNKCQSEQRSRAADPFAN